MSGPSETSRAARGLIVEAIARYRSTLATSERIAERWADPEGPPAEDDAEAASRRRVRAVADEAWDSAEMNLAWCIERLYDELAPPGRRAGEDDTPYHVGRGVRHRGWVYILAEPTEAFSSRNRVIAVYREGMVVGLARRPRGRHSP